LQTADKPAGALDLHFVWEYLGKKGAITSKAKNHWAQNSLAKNAPLAGQKITTPKGQD